MAICICQNCGKEFKNRAKKKYCSRECLNESKHKKVKYYDFVCQQCGKPFKRLRRQVEASLRKGSPTKYCSVACANKARQVEMTCPNCGKKLIRPAARFRKDLKNAYCSRECWLEAHHTTIECRRCGKLFTQKKTDENIHCPECISYLKEHPEEKYAHRKVEHKYETRYCKECGKPFEVLDNAYRQYCSYACASKKRRTGFYKKCEQCGKEIYVTPARAKERRFCSKKCAGQSRRKDNKTYEHMAHIIRTSTPYYEWRSRVIDNARATCQRCGATGEDIILHAHHKRQLYWICKQYDFNIEKVLSSKDFLNISNGECLCETCHNNVHKQLNNLVRNEKGQFCRLEPTHEETQDDQCGIKRED